MWKKERTPFDDLYVITPFFSDDMRGSFVKTFEMDIFSDLNIPNIINEVFISSSKHNVIRGMHFQYRNPQTKYVSVLKGKIYDVAIDLRKGSKTFGKWHAVELSADNRKIYYIPKGFAHGFQVTSEEDAIVQYQCSGKYDGNSDSGILWNDLEIAVEWPEENNVIISERDNNQMTFAEFKDKIHSL